MMIHRADDDEIDSIELSVLEDRPTEELRMVAEVPIDDDSVRRIIVAFLTVRDDWDDLELLARCVAQRRSTSSDRRSVTFPNSRFGEPGRIYLADGTEEPVDVAEGPALRLLARWLRLLVETAPDDVLPPEEWAAFVSDVDAIERDAAAIAD